MVRSLHWVSGYRLRFSPKEAGCLNSLVGTLIQSSVGNESFQEWVRWRVEKRPQGNVGPEVVKGLMPVDTEKGRLVRRGAGGWEAQDTGALRAVWSCGVNYFKLFKLL